MSTITVVPDVLPSLSFTKGKSLDDLKLSITSSPSLLILRACEEAVIKGSVRKYNLGGKDFYLKKVGIGF